MTGQCNGNNPCSLCAARGVSVCEYPMHERMEKKILVDKIDPLDHRHSTDNWILRAIATHEGVSFTFPWHCGQDGEALPKVGKIGH